MPSYTDLLIFYNESAPRGTPYSTGYTFNTTSTGLSMYAQNSCTTFIKNVSFMVASGTVWTSFHIQYPNIHTSGVVQMTYTGDSYKTLRDLCSEVRKLPDGQGQEYDCTGGVFYKFNLALQKAIYLVGGNSDLFKLAFNGLSGGFIDCHIDGWHVLEADDQL